MNLARIISSGLGGWLQFEFACGRSSLFDERYLSAAIAQILGGTRGGRILSEFEHPILHSYMTGPGRRPAIDFVYCEDYPRITIAVEAKWASSSHATVENIIWDLLRLEQVAHHHGATSLFVLAGKRADLRRLFLSEKFLGRQGPFARGPILNIGSNANHIFPLVPEHPYRISLLRKIFIDLQGLPIPHRIRTVRATPFPEEVPLNHYQVYVWNVRPDYPRMEFLPSKIRSYHVPPTERRT
jgi:hypothetical protein